MLILSTEAKSFKQYHIISNILLLQKQIKQYSLSNITWSCTCKQYIAYLIKLSNMFLSNILIQAIYCFLKIKQYILHVYSMTCDPMALTLALAVGTVGQRIMIWMWNCWHQTVDMVEQGRYMHNNFFKLTIHVSVSRRYWRTCYLHGSVAEFDVLNLM